MSKLKTVNVQATEDVVTHARFLDGGRQQEAAVGLPELLRLLWRYRAVIGGTMFLLTTIATIVLFQITPVYTANALVLIDSRQTNVVDVQAVVSGLPKDMETIESEILVMRSRGMAADAVSKLQLYDNPEFNSRLQLKSFWQEKVSIPVTQWLKSLFGESQAAPVATELEFDRERVEIVDAFLENLEIRRIGRSRVIEIAASSSDPETAMLMANTVGELYLLEQLETKFETTKRATNWLSERLSELRATVEQAEQEVEAFRSQSGLVEGERASLVVEHVSDLNRQIVLARRDRAEAVARLRQVESLLNGASGVESAAEVLASPLIQRLREQEAEVKGRAAELSMEYGDKHPRMVNVRAEIKDLESKIQDEVNKVVQNLRNEVAVAYARERSLAASLGEVEDRAAELNEKEVGLRALEREANASRLLYETFLTRFKETRGQEELQQSDARIIAPADLPTRPAFPNKRLILVLALAGSAVLGIGLALFIELLDRGFRSMEQVESLTGLPAIGFIPQVGNIWDRPKKLLTGQMQLPPEKLVTERPGSAFGESIRSLYTALLLSNVSNPPKIVLVTSAVPEEGKTAISLSLCRLVAMFGRRSIVIDADLRRSSVHGRMGLDAQPGLVDYLTGACDLPDVIQKDQQTGADVIAAGGTLPNAVDFLNSVKMEELLSRLGADYDLVIVDSPPVGSVADARILARFADKTVMVVRWAGTPREVARMAIKQLLEAGADIAGVALSLVDIKKNSGYSYGDSQYYHGASKKYYTS